MSYFKKIPAFIIFFTFLGFLVVLFFIKPPVDIAFPLVPSPTPIPSQFTLVVLPDTQVYSQLYPEIFISQTDWIVENKDKLNIVFVSHVGDVVQSQVVDKEWRAADKAMSLLDGVVPYGLLPGNHDNLAKFNEYFPYSRYKKETWYGGHYGDTNSSNYQFFSALGLDFIILHLQNYPDEKVLDWADRILAEHANRRAIVVSHNILNYGGFRTDIGEKIFTALKDNPNLFLMLCGHIHIEDRRADQINGQVIYQLLADYQVRENGGNGLLRILNFVPDEDKIYVRTYSPYTDQFEVDENSDFVLDYEMS